MFLLDTTRNMQKNHLQYNFKVFWAFQNLPVGIDEFRPVGIRQFRPVNKVSTIPSQILFSKKSAQKNEYIFTYRENI